VRYIVSIKSGPSWGNSQAVNKMISNFNTARKILRTSNSKINVVAVNGCCYSRNKKPYREKGDYFKYCGQQFWEFISGNENLYTEIIEPLGHKAKERNEEFMVAYAQIINKFTLDFMNEFCIDGKIDWEKLVKFNSGKASN
ncbi:MAG: cytosolic protein, partial [Bacteroidetes bacterium]